MSVVENKSNSCNRYLLLGSDERLWKFDRPVVFLGEWCCQYKRKDVWSKMDFIVSKPYGVGCGYNKEGLNSDFKDARGLEEMLFPVFCNALNLHHNVQYDSKFWKIVLGHWFVRCISVIYNRVKTLQQCLDSYNINEVSLLDSNHYSLASADSKAAIWSFSDDRWNTALFARIFEIINFSKVRVETVPDSRNSSRYRLPEVKRENKRLFRKVQGCINDVACFFSKQDDVFIVNSYLPLTVELQLHIKLGQVPKIRRSGKNLIDQSVDFLLRKKLSKEMRCDNATSEIEGVLRGVLFEMIPICYLEGFSELFKSTTFNRYPINPKVIFTSNNFDTDEVFKLWTARKVMNGSKYIVGQHGNGYGTDKRDQSIQIEVTDSYRFITWGWGEYKDNTVPGFIFKTVGKSKEDTNMLGGMLLILSVYPHRMHIWDEAFKYMSHFENQKKMISRLSVNIRKNLTIRLHSESSRTGWNELERLLDFDNNLNICQGGTPIEEAVRSSRLVLHGYDSTGMLETLSSNTPTLAWWGEGLDHVTSEARPYYQLLVDAGIVHFSEKSIVDKINSIWDDVDDWWQDKDLQEARREFCRQYARNSDNPLGELVKFLTI